MYKPIPGLTYSISKNGKIKNSIGYTMRPFLTKPGRYLKIKITENGKRKNKTVHDLMMLTYDPNYTKNKKKYVIHHRDHNPKNNKLENLQWITHKDNIRLYYTAKKHGEL